MTFGGISLLRYYCSHTSTHNNQLNLHSCVMCALVFVCVWRIIHKLKGDRTLIVSSFAIHNSAIGTILKCGKDPHYMCALVLLYSHHGHTLPAVSIFSYASISKLQHQQNPHACTEYNVSTIISVPTRILCVLPVGTTRIPICMTHALLGPHQCIIQS